MVFLVSLDTTTLAVVVIQPIYTSISDIIGRKAPLYIAIGLFFIGSIAFSVAKSMAVIILGCVLQGLGGGGLDVLSEVIVADITTLQERPLYIGLLSLPMAAGSILGPILGALFSEYVDWRWIGGINLPVIAVAVVLAIFFMRLKQIGKPFREQTHPLDWLGILLFLRTIVSLVIGVLVLIVFAVYEAQPVKPVFPYRIFRSRTAQVTLIGSFIHGMVLYTLLQYLPLFFQAIYLESPLRSSISILPFCVVVMAFTGIAAWAVDIFRHYRWEIWTGWVFLAVGVIASIGIGTIFTVPPISMQASAPSAEDQGLAMGIMVSFRLFGALIGLAIGATTFSTVFENSMASVGPLPETLTVLKNANEAVGFIPQLATVDMTPALRDALRGVYLEAIRTIWYVLAALGGVASLAPCGWRG
ncbi:major facilitator superfamily domain-containing protein [Aspergillus caelatus]|uniref:Major facilitator superfamily domain-containing protein n=1 Tax=Aspergillus caelatus TaxID=61420 RepID=A0A5N7AI41_9EURO|nr:major facilitator superfamily domain-containing protein [Aspergillus caelatus]KAE8369551.1 major facilitator superfamily domain-containing protein [Aspergillus caelatus]